MTFFNLCTCTLSHYQKLLLLPPSSAVLVCPLCRNFFLLWHLAFSLALLVHCGTGRHRCCVCMSVCFSSELLFAPRSLAASDSTSLTEPRRTNNYQGKIYAALFIDVSLIYKWDHRDWTITQHTPTDIHHWHTVWVETYKWGRFNNVLLMAVLIIAVILSLFKNWKGCKTCLFFFFFLLRVCERINWVCRQSVGNLFFPWIF